MALTEDKIFTNLAAQPTHRSVAQYVYRHYPNLILQVDDDVFLLTLENRWKKVKVPDLHTPVYNAIIKLMSLHKQIRRNEYDQKLFNEICNKFRKYIENNSQMSSILRELLPMYSRDLAFDDNPNLIGFTDGVLDLTTMTPRLYKSDDYITMTVGYKYSNNINQQKTAELYALFNKILPDPEMQKCVLSILASCLRGVQSEYFNLFLGNGRNGKSTISTLMLNALGDYAYILAVNVLTSKDKSTLSPEKAQLHLKRYILCSEPETTGNNEAGAVINVSQIKRLTGSSAIVARQLWSNSLKTKLRGTYVYECNEIPSFNIIDTAIQQRIMYIPFETKFILGIFNDAELFTRNDPLRPVYKADDSFNTDGFAVSHRLEFMHILIQTFLQSNGQPYYPQEVGLLSNQYLINQSPFLTWFTRNFTRDLNSPAEQWVSVDFIYTIFTSQHNVRRNHFENENAKHITIDFITLIFESVTFFGKDKLTHPNGNVIMRYWILNQAP